MNVPGSGSAPGSRPPPERCVIPQTNSQPFHHPKTPLLALQGPWARPLPQASVAGLNLPERAEPFLGDPWVLVCRG